MDKFDNVSVVKKANIYFKGNVTSRTIIFPDGSKKTLGVILPGEYNFNTDKAEIMDIMSGKCKYKIKGSNDWVSISGGKSFTIPAKSSFDIVAEEIVDYCCSFID